MDKVNPQRRISRPPVRVIARLDVKGPNVVKGIQLEGLRIVGKPQEMARRYYRAGIDELLFMDIVASLYQRNSILDIVRATAAEAFVPITVGGGLRSVEDAVGAIRSGADKVAINTAAIARPAFLTEIAHALGSQAVVVSIEAKRRAGGWEALTDNGRERTGVDALAWAAEAERLGAGELLITSIDREGSTQGMDLELLAEIRRRVQIPVIASGGVGRSEHVSDVLSRDLANAVACAHVLHYQVCDVASVKARLASDGVPVRPIPAFS